MLTTLRVAGYQPATRVALACPRRERSVDSIRRGSDLHAGPGRPQGRGTTAL